MQELMKFENAEFEDGVMCYEQDGVVYLSLRDVVKGLGFARKQNKGGKDYDLFRWGTVRERFAKLGLSPFPGKKSYIPEDVFRRLAAKTRNGMAERFRAWVTDEVIPSARECGKEVAVRECVDDVQFVKTRQTPVENVHDDRTALRLKLFSSDPLDVAEAHKALVEIEMKPLLETIEQQKTMAAFANAVTKSLGNIEIGEMAKILKECGIGIGERRLLWLLRDVGVLMENNFPCQTYLDRGYFFVREDAYERGGENKLYMTTLVTPRGQVWLVNKVPEWMAV